jgi:hypothetical protein
VDEKLRQLLAEIPESPPRSKLEPHLDVIRQLRRKRLTYREIAAFLQTHAGVSVHWTTIHAFLKVRARRRCDELRPKYEMPEPTPAPAPAAAAPPQGQTDFAAIKLRIAEKVRAQELQAQVNPRFTYEEGEPLILKPRPEE